MDIVLIEDEDIVRAVMDDLLEVAKGLLGDDLRKAIADLTKRKKKE